MKEIGVKHGGLDNKPETLFDGVTFNPAKPEEYAQSFQVKNLKAERPDATTMTKTQDPLRHLGAAAARGGRALLLALWAADQRHLVEEPAVAGEDLGGVEAVRRRAVREARRARSGDRALRLVLAVAGREGLRARAAARARRSGFMLGRSKLFAKSFDPIIQVLRPVSPLAWLPLGLVLFEKSHPAALFTIAICAMWPTVLNTALGVRSIPQDYLNVARVLQLSPREDVLQGAAAGDAALHVHRLPPQPGDRLAGDRRRRDADRLARDRRLPLAGVQQPHLRAHHPVHPHHRHRRLRPRPPDERGRTPADGVACPMAFLELSRRRQGIRRKAARDARCSRDIDLAVERGEFVAIVGYSGAGKTTLISLIAGLTDARSAGRSRSTASRSPGPGADRGVVFQNYSLLPWLTAYENVLLAVDQRFATGRRAEARPHREAPGAGEPGGGARQEAVRAVGRHAPARGGGARAGRAIPRCC